MAAPPAVENGGIWFSQRKDAFKTHFFPPRPGARRRTAQNFSDFVESYALKGESLRGAKSASKSGPYKTSQKINIMTGRSAAFCFVLLCAILFQNCWIPAGRSLHLAKRLLCVPYQHQVTKLTPNSDRLCQWLDPMFAPSGNPVSPDKWPERKKLFNFRPSFVMHAPCGRRILSPTEQLKRFGRGKVTTNLQISYIMHDRVDTQSFELICCNLTLFFALGCIALCLCLHFAERRERVEKFIKSSTLVVSSVILDQRMGELSHVDRETRCRRERFSFFFAAVYSACRNPKDKFALARGIQKSARRIGNVA